MKTSNKLILAAILIIIISMVTYDLALRAEYRKGNYKSRFYGMEKLKFKEFKTINIHAANLIAVNIEHGDNFAVWVNNDLKDRIKISQNGTALEVDTAVKKNTSSRNYYGNVVIICPSVERVVTSAALSAKEGEHNYGDNEVTNLSGFNQQNLTLLINKSTHLNFEKNKVEHLQAIVGNGSSKSAYLFITSNNQINDAIIKVLGKNQLNIENPKITKSTFDISDSANVSLGGSILKQLRHQ